MQDRLKSSTVERYATVFWLNRWSNDRAVSRITPKALGLGAHYFVSHFRNAGTKMIENFRNTFRNSYLLFAVLIATVLFPSLATASTPRLNTILPRGVKAGGEYVLKFSGSRLAGAEQVFFYDTGITVVSIEQVDANNVNVKVNVAADCRIGEHVAQLRTKKWHLRLSISFCRKTTGGCRSRTQQFTWRSTESRNQCHGYRNRDKRGH